MAQTGDRQVGSSPAGKTLGFDGCGDEPRQQRWPLIRPSLQYCLPHGDSLSDGDCFSLEKGALNSSPPVPPGRLSEGWRQRSSQQCAMRGRQVT